MTHHDDPQEHDEQDAAGGQVSEVSAMSDDGPEAIDPSDATAGTPDGESGRPQEGTAGPNAAPRHDPPEPTNESSR